MNKQLRHCLCFAQSFPDEKIVFTLQRQLSWTHKAIAIAQNSLSKRKGSDSNERN